MAPTELKKKPRRKPSLPIFKIGDKVTIINNGHPIWISTTELDPKGMQPPILEGEHYVYTWKDLSPELIGKMALVNGINNTNSRPKYSLEMKMNEMEWYDENQLEFAIKPNK